MTTIQSRLRVGGGSGNHWQELECEVVRLMESGVRRQVIADIYGVHRRTLYTSIARLK